MRNVSPLCSDEERKYHVQYYMDRMQMSGYTPSERVEVYKLAYKKYKQIVENAEDGTAPMYRSKHWKHKEREREKVKKRSNWFQKGGYDTTFFVDATPKSELARKCRNVMKSAGLPIKVIEKAGKTLKRCLVKSNPFQQESCESPECNTCRTNPSVNCKKRDIVYKISCLGDDSTCESFYIGESSRSIEERYKEHVDKYNKDPNSGFHKHSLEKHGGVHPNLKLEILSAHPGDAMLRQITESVNISKNVPDINSKEEWSCSNVPRLRKEHSQ